MNFLRLHWFDLGALLTIGAAVWLALIWSDISWYDRLCWLRLIVLCLHQLEEYRVVGTFPGMLNAIVFQSDRPDRYPLNTNTSLIINVCLGWTILIAAIAAGTHAVWIGIAAMFIHAANAAAHLIVFNIRGRMLYNPGAATSLLLLVPLVVFFVLVVTRDNLATTTDWIVGILLGAALSYLGLIKTLFWLADYTTQWAFPPRCLPMSLRPGITAATHHLSSDDS